MPAITRNPEVDVLTANEEPSVLVAPNPAEEPVRESAALDPTLSDPIQVEGEPGRERGREILVPKDVSAVRRGDRVSDGELVGTVIKSAYIGTGRSRIDAWSVKFDDGETGVIVKAAVKFAWQTERERIAPGAPARSPKMEVDGVAPDSGNLPKKKVEDIVVGRLLEALEMGVVPWHKPWKIDNAPRNGQSERPYRGLNPFILSLVGQLRGYEDQRWLTLGQIRKAGGSVLDGEFKKSVPVVFWKWLDVPVKGEDRNRPGVTKDENGNGTKRIPLLRFYNVWNVAQTEGVQLKPLPEPREINPIPAAQAVVDRYISEGGPRLHVGGDRAAYAPLLDQIVMPQQRHFKDDQAYFATLFHEMTHSTGHHSRLGRFGQDMVIPHFGTQDYSKEELVAELGSAMLCAHAGIDQVSQIEASAAYCNHWLGVLREEPKFLINAAAQAQRAVDHILDQKPGDDSAGDDA